MIQPRSYDCIVKDWLDAAIYGNEQRYNNRGHHGERVFHDGRSIYSYGHHFEMARVLFEKGEATTILVNGERASVTTSKHQNVLRSAIQRHMSNLPSVIIPFGAIDAARIDMDTIRIIDVQQDRQIPTHHESDSPPRHYNYLPPTKEYEVDEWTDEELERWRMWHRHNDWQVKLDNLLAQARTAQATIEEHGEDYKKYDWQRLTSGDELAHVQREIAKHHAAGINMDAWCTSSPKPKLEPTGEVVSGVYAGWSRSIEGYLADGTFVRGVQPGIDWRVPDSDGQWRWTTYLHVLGESLIEADVHAWRRVTCEDCSGDGVTRRAMPVLPTGYWHSYGGEVVTRVRVPIPTTAESYGERDYIRSWRHWETIDMQVAILPLPRDHYDCPTCRGTGKVRTPIKRRKVKFLSGFDHGEPHLAYFFCELPKCDATTVDEAYEALKPDVVKLAEQMGRNVVRQGDVFAIETTATTRELKGKAKRIGRRNADDGSDERAASMLLGTNHQGTHVIHCKDGTVYAKGCMWHVPDGRTNDHVRKKLGDGKAWHIIVKNTVPVRQS
jgi:hypothetical protein